MEYYTEEEVESIKARYFDKGRRWGLLVMFISVFVSAIIAAAILNLYY